MPQNEFLDHVVQPTDEPMHQLLHQIFVVHEPQVEFLQVDQYIHGPVHEHVEHNDVQPIE